MVEGVHVGLVWVTVKGYGVYVYMYSEWGGGRSSVQVQWNPSKGHP